MSPENGGDKKEAGSFFCLFVYPFLFPQSDYGTLLERLYQEPAWKLDVIDLRDEKNSRHLRYLYPYARHFLFPTHNRGVQEQLQRCFPHAKIYGWDATGPQAHRIPPLNREQWKLLRSWQVVRWRWDFDAAAALKPQFFAEVKLGDQEICVRAAFTKISLLVFPTGVGLLLLEVTPQGALAPRECGAWARQFSTIEPLPSGIPAAALIFPDDGCRVEETGTAPSLNRPLKEVIEGILLRSVRDLCDEASYATGAAVLHRYLFWCRGPGPEDAAEAKGALESILAELDPGCRGPLAARARFQGVETVAYFTAQGATIVSRGSPSFTCEILAGHWRTFYFDLFLHALYHRLSLLRFADELSRTEELVRHADRVRELRRRFLEFTNRAWFSHVVPTEYGNLIWRKWREVMETPTLYEEVKGYLTELSSFLEEERREWYKRLSNHLVTVGFAVSLFSAALTAGLVEPLPGGVSGWVGVGLGFGIPLAVVWLLLRVLHFRLYRTQNWKLRGGPASRCLKSRVGRWRKGRSSKRRGAQDERNSFSV